MRNTIIAIVMSFSLSGTSFAGDNSSLTDSAVSILSALKDSSQVEYYDASRWLGSIETGFFLLPSMMEMKHSVLEGKRFLVDYSGIRDARDKSKAKKAFEDSFGFGFDSDYLIISSHKGELLFTPFDNPYDKQKIELLDRDDPTTLIDITAFDEIGSIPNVSFYFNVRHTIDDSFCSFPKSSIWNYGDMNLCGTPNISLIYRVNLQRSLKFNSTGSSTPDAKIVRISLDDDTSGGGIHLNKNIESHLFKAPHIPNDGWVYSKVSSAIAQDYTFEFDVSNTKASILKAVPTNYNHSYEVKDVSGFTFGVSGSLAGDKSGPKASLEANASYNQQRWLTFNTHDYEVVRTTPSNDSVHFVWNRQQYAKGNDILRRWTDPLWIHDIPVDYSKINPISYSSFIPKMDVIYHASSNEIGSTKFNIGTSVMIRPFYHQAYLHNITYQSYQGNEHTELRRRFKVKDSFNVNWEHAVFTGGRAVNLQFAGDNNTCIEVDEKFNIRASTCNNSIANQSFIYDQHKRYVSAINVNYCLDGLALADKTLQKCNSNLSQRWEWKNSQKDYLYNTLNSEILSYNKDKDTFYLSGEADNSVDVYGRFITSYTDLFQPNIHSPSYGYIANTPLYFLEMDSTKILYVGYEPYESLGSMGVEKDHHIHMIGGDDLNIEKVDLNGVSSVDVTWGRDALERTKILSLTFHYNSGKSKTVGSTKYSQHIAGREIYHFPQSTEINTINIWSYNDASSGETGVNGIKFILNKM